mgnify:CR=1 FL=1
MKAIVKLIALALAAATTFGPANAHHSYSMFDMAKTVELEATVTQFKWQNPHSFILADVEAPRGKRIGVNTMYSELKADSPENGNNIYGVWPNLTQSHLRLACSEVGPNCPKTNLYGTGAFITANEAIYSVNEVESNHFVGSTNVNYAPIESLRLDGTFGVDAGAWGRPRFGPLTLLEGDLRVR